MFGKFDEEHEGKVTNEACLLLGNRVGELYGLASYVLDCNLLEE